MAFNGRLPKEIPAGTAFGSWVVVEEAARSEGKVRNRRFLCRCSVCGGEAIKYLSNLLHGKGCVCTIDYLALSAPGRAKAEAARRARVQASDEGRMCLTCDTWKLWSEFTGATRARGGKASNCKSCSHHGTIRRAFGLTPADWAWLHESQGGVCVLCGEPESGGKRLSVDHDHSCCPAKKGCKLCIRGLLCGVCNMTLGLAEKRPVVVVRFADYLVRRPFASVTAGLALPVLEDVRGLLAEDAA